MGLNLYTIKISSPNLMENIICSYRGNFKATFLNLFLFYYRRQKNDVRMQHISPRQDVSNFLYVNSIFLSLVYRCLSESKYTTRKASALLKTIQYIKIKIIYKCWSLNAYGIANYLWYTLTLVVTYCVSNRMADNCCFKNQGCKWVTCRQKL